jgi:AcrR family transcriptional regulator
MSSPVKRNYSSEKRAARARETRRSVVSAAARLFTSRGFARTTAEDIAAEAGVSRKTVFATGSKTGLLKLAMDWAITGDDEDVPPAGRPVVAALRRESRPEAIVAGWAAMSTRISARVAPLSRALTVAAALDDEAAGLWRRTQDQRLRGARAFARFLAARGGVRPGISIDDATDLVWLHSDPALYHRLVNERGWSQAKFERWLAGTLAAQLSGPG